MKPQIRLILLCWAVLGACVLRCSAQAESPRFDVARPPELGQVDWQRDLAKARLDSQHGGKPVLVLFQEVPGCATCQAFGSRTLSHPLLVEAMEDLFIPVLVYNNKEGTDKANLDAFGEPAWNNPVIRYVDAAGGDLIPRKDGIWNSTETAQRLVAALNAAKRPVPEYLQTLADEVETGTQRATIAMHCFWEGEAKLGSLAGVTGTRAGWLHGQEVVEVDFDPRTIPLSGLVSQAMQMQCASTVFARDDLQAREAKQGGARDVQRITDDVRATDAKTADQKYYLRNSDLIHLPLTPIQALRLNSALATRRPYDTILSPRQQALIERIRLRLLDDSEALVAWNCPEDPSQLADYAIRLNSFLDNATAHDNNDKVDNQALNAQEPSNGG